jgi:voltage-gated potassium channel
MVKINKIKQTEIIIAVLAVVSIILVAIDSLVSLSRGALIGIYAADLLICIVFAIDFFRRMKASQNKSQFMRNSWFEILAMIPALALYALGTIPVLAVAFRALRLIRVILILARMRRVISVSGKFIKRSKLLSLFGITVGIIFIGAFAALVLDSGAENAKITNFPDAVWWSISTVTIVGYGDIVPSSMAARIMGMFLMVVGIGVMTAFISQVSATLVESRLKQRGEREKDGFKSAIISEIKNGIDNIDKLSESEVSLLMQMIKTLKTQGENNE